MSCQRAYIGRRFPLNIYYFIIWSKRISSIQLLLLTVHQCFRSNENRVILDWDRPFKFHKYDKAPWFSWRLFHWNGSNRNKAKMFGNLLNYHTHFCCFGIPNMYTWFKTGKLCFSSQFNSILNWTHMITIAISRTHNDTFGSMVLNIYFVICTTSG